MKLITFILFAAMLVFPNIAHASGPVANKKWDKLTETSGQVLQLVREKKYAEAKQLLDYFEKQFHASKKDLDLSMKDLRILTTTFDHAKRAVTNVSASHETRVTIVTQFFLVVDALYSENQPLWLSTKDQLFQPFNKMKQAATEKNDLQFQHYLNQFLSKYEMIHPSLNIDLSDPLIGKLDSEVQYLMNHRIDFFSQPYYMQHLDRMDKDFHALYNGTLRNSVEPTLPWVIISIGGIIVIALFYSGWQKYKAEERARRRRKKVKKRSKF